MYLINPMAGRGSFRSGLGDVLESFCLAGYLPTLYMTKSSGDAMKITQTHASDYDLLVCQGGDGTLSEVISGLMRIENPPPLGYIPMGTANDVAVSLELPADRPHKAAERIIHGRAMPFDVGSFGSDEYFAYIAAFGTLAGVSYETPQNTKHTLGYLAYLLEGMRRLTKIDSFETRVEYDGGVIDDELVFGGVTNSTSIAGVVKLNKNVVELSDGLFEVVLIRNPHSLSDMNSIIMDIISQNYSSQNVTVLHSRSVRFQFEEEVAWTRDGENGGMHRDLTLTNHHEAIQFVV